MGVTIIGSSVQAVAKSSFEGLGGLPPLRIIALTLRGGSVEMRRRSALCAYALVLGLTSIFAGCAPTRSRELQYLQFDDVPVPKGFVLMDMGDESFSYVDEGLRVGHLRYEGQKTAETVQRFYRDTMNLHGWQASTAAVPLAGNGSLLQYEKAEQRCSVQIREDTGRTHLTIKVRGPVAISHGQR